MILALLQARVSSSRLPGKVLEPILGEPMLFRQIERLCRCRQVGRLVVATSTDPSDDRLVSECHHRSVAVHRGSLSDVLGRFAAAVEAYRPDIVVRLTGDCPLADWQVIDRAIAEFGAGSYDYLSNTDPATYPDGLDVEVMTAAALLAAAAEARLPSEREHVTLFIRNHSERFTVGSLRAECDLSALRWTVDNPEDLEFVRRVYETLYPSNPQFTTADILVLLAAKPELSMINAHIPRNAGLQKSLAADQAGVLAALEK